MSIANLKKLKKDLLLMKKNSNKEKIVIKALDGLFLIDFKVDINNREERIKAIKEAPEDMNINIIGANIDDIGLCGGFGEPLIIVHDIDVVDAPDIKVINIEPATKVI